MMKRITRTVSCVLVAGIVVVAAACDDDETGLTGLDGDARVQVLLTDAPTDSLSEATVWISRAYLQAGAGPDGPGIDLFNAEDEGVDAKEFDLLDLQNDITAELTDASDIESGTYQQLRLVVDSARVTLAEVDTDGDDTPDTQLTFQDGSESKLLFVPSGMQSGIKVQLDAPIDADADELTIVVVDFDVNDSFVFQASPQAGIRDVLFTPVLHERGRTEESGDGGDGGTGGGA